MKSLPSRDSGLSLWFVFLLWPVLALVSSIKNYRSSWAKNGLLLFIVFYGYTFLAQEGNDSARYIEYFNELQSTETDYKTFSKMFYSEGQKSVDIYGPSVAFLVSRFTDDPRILFSVIALFYGFFYTRNIWKLIERAGQDNSVLLKFFLIIFAFVIPVWSINGIRFWTAAQVFCYGAMLYLLDGKVKGIIISALTILIHFSFAFPVLILFLYIIIGNKPKLYFAFLIIGIFFSEVNIPAVTNTLLAYSPDIFHDRVTGYTDIDRIARRMTEISSVNWYVKWHLKVLHISVDILLIAIFLKGKETWYKRKNLANLFSFILLLRATASMLMQIPTIERFIRLNDLMSMGFVVLFLIYSKSDLFARRVTMFVTPALAFFLLVTIRTGLDNTGLLSIISNPIIAPFLPNDLAIIDLIK